MPVIVGHKMNDEYRLTNSDLRCDLNTSKFSQRDTFGIKSLIGVRYSKNSKILKSPLYRGKLKPPSQKV